MGTMDGSHGLRSGRRSGGASSRAAADGQAPKAARKGGFFSLLVEIWPFIRPHRRLLLVGFLLMIINRLAGLVLPASMKFLVDDVLGKRIVSTRLRGNVTIREANAAAALEVMSRFAANPKWLIYLPPGIRASRSCSRFPCRTTLAAAFRTRIGRSA